MKKLKTAGKLQQQIALSIPLLCALQSVSALGLGELSVNSSLNQPLAVSIPINLSSGEKVTADQIITGLANAAEHNRAGLPYANILKDLRFNIIRSPQGKLVLNINSQRSLYEPIINFLVDVNWDQGHLIKEISIFLDPPNYQTTAETKPVPAPILTRSTPAVTTRQISQPAAKDEPAAPVANRNRRQPAASKPIRIKDGNYTVQRGDSLSKIASAARKQSGLSMKEAMALIYDMNPDAFMGSMDQLKAGADLSIPDMKVVTKTVAEPVKPAPVPAPPAATQKAPEAVVEKQPEPVVIAPPEIVTAPSDGPRLEIVPPEELTSPSETTALATEAGTTEALANNAQASEQMIELQSQLGDIQGENSQLKNTLDDTRSQLDDTRSQLNDTHQALSDIREEMKSLLEMQRSQNPGSPASVKTWINWAPWLLTALALGLLALFGFRRKQQPAVLSDTLYTSSPSPREIANMAETEIDHPDTSIPQAPPEVTSLLDSNEMFSDETMLSEDDSTQVVPPSALMDDDLTSEEVASELDSVQEAEIYLAYHQYSLAEKSISQLLKDDPNNHIFKLLQLRLLAETGKMNEMQTLSVELFRQFPDRSDETHQRIQSICDKAFTATDASDDAATHLLSVTGETELKVSPDQQEQTSETFIQEDMTDFLSDATATDTQPAIDTGKHEPEADTILVEDQDLTLPEYKQVSEDINFIAEDLTEEGLDLPFDLETEILEEEARRMAADREEKEKKDS